MTERILFFTANAVLTDEEKQTLEALNALTAPAYSVTVHSAAVEPDYIAPGDYVVGPAPSAYAELPIFNPDEPPGTIGDDQAVVNDGQAIDLLPATGSASSGTVTADIADQTLNGVRLSADAGLVTDGQAFEVDGGSVTATVTDNAVTLSFEPDAPEDPEA